MKRTLTVAILILLLQACGSKAPVAVAKEGPVKILAVYKSPKGGKKADLLLRQIGKRVVTNDNGDEKIITDTIWGYPVVTSLLNPKGKPVLDSAGNSKLDVHFIIIGKDSVNWKVENVPIEDLLKP